jgi:hypothetical protein
MTDTSQQPTPEETDAARKRDRLDDVPANVAQLPEPVEPTRRGVLRTSAAAVVAGAASTLGLTGAAAAESEYASKRAVGSTLKRQIPGVLADLVEQGYLDGQAEVLDADLYRSKTAYRVASNAIGVFEVSRGGQTVTKLAVKRSVKGGTFHLAVYPDLGTHELTVS